LPRAPSTRAGLEAAVKEKKRRVHLSQAPGGMVHRPTRAPDNPMTALMVYCVQLHEEYLNIIFLRPEV
jgi:hypothetical protein